MSSQKIIYTIGHSTHTIKDFVALLHASNIEFLIDVRSFPGSRKYPHFHKENLAPVLEHEGIQYIHMRELGGRRKALPDSHNTAWRNISFRGYADYMETQEFRDGIERLEKIASHGTTAYMCSEAVWWRCHRSMISDFLLSRGWTVLHIMALGKVMEHSYTAPAYLIWEALISRRRIRECIPYTIISLTNRFRDTPEVIETETITKAHHKKTSRSREVSEAIMGD